MAIDSLLAQKNMSAYRCAKESGIPYTTLLELVRGKTRIEKCSAETVYKLAKLIGVTMEELIELHQTPPRLEFETFKGNAQHLLKRLGDLEFIIQLLEENTVRKYWELKWYPEAFYLLAMLDYLCRVNELKLCGDYNDIRGTRLPEMCYPKDIYLKQELYPGMDLQQILDRAAIPEFARFNIYEVDIRDVC